jgi:hypothetical protein
LAATFERSLGFREVPNRLQLGAQKSRIGEWQRRKVIIVDPSANSIGDRIKEYWVVNVSGQIVPIEALLEDSVADLIKRIE